MEVQITATIGRILYIDVASTMQQTYPPMQNRQMQ